MWGCSMMISNYINKQDLQDEIDAGYVRIQCHPTLPLAILNYTDKATFDGWWTELQQRCRGLVVEWKVDQPRCRVIINSPRKFFNHTEPLAPNTKGWLPSDVWVSEKLDGYYISVRDDSEYGLIVTSRGSFGNKYVDAAKKLLPKDFAKDTDYFCELCQDFPGDENIIVARHPQKRLVCWGVNETVPMRDNTGGWTGHIASRLSPRGYFDHMDGENEGVVAYNLRTKERVKVKTQWYLMMHRMISQCTFKRVLEIYMGGGEVCSPKVGRYTTTYTDAQGETHEIDFTKIPEEVFAKMEEWSIEICQEFDKVCQLVIADYKAYKDKTPKEYALECDSPNDIKSLVFKRFKTSPEHMDEAVWKVVKKRLLSKPNHE